jgi:hypothetical protein
MWSNLSKQKFDLPQGKFLQAKVGPSLRQFLTLVFEVSEQYQLDLLVDLPQQKVDLL